MNGDKITNAAKVMFCPDVNLEVQMSIFATNERLTFLDIDRKSGTIIELVDIAERYIKNHTRWRVEFDGGLQRNEIPEVPIEAIREALINSFCHKDYRSSQNNEVVIYKNRIEIYNPGTFPEGLTPQNFIDRPERSVHRNPLLAQILYYSEDIESFGTGLRRIASACQDADVKLEFEMLKMGFAVVFHRKDVSEIVVNKMGRIVSDKMSDMSDISSDMSDKIPDISSREAIIINYLKTNSFITNQKACKLLSVSTATTRRFLQSMSKKGLISAEGENKGRRYKLYQ